MPSDINVDFTKHSNFDSRSNFESVVWGANGPVTEMELNESQLIQDSKIKRIIKHLIGDGVYGNIEINDDNVLTINDAIISVGGYLLETDSIELEMSVGDKAYIDVRVVTTAYNDVVYKNGNEQDAHLINKIMDERYGVEITRRRQIVYNLVKTTSEDSICSLEIGELTDDGFIKSCKKLTILDSIEDKFQETNGVVLMGTLNVGETSLIIEDNIVAKNDYYIDVYTDSFGVNPKKINIEDGKITMDFDPLEYVLKVKVILKTL